MNAELFIALLKAMMFRRKKPVLLILDSLPAHKAKIVKDYVASTDGKLEFHFLPGYAPELNPDEMVWNYMKRTGTARKPLAKGELLHDRIDVELQQIQENRALVRSFFRAELSPILVMIVSVLDTVTSPCSTPPARDLCAADLISGFQNFLLTPNPNQHYSDLVPLLRGALRNVTDAGSGMRWTRAARLTGEPDADGEVVWS